MCFCNGLLTGVLLTFNSLVTSIYECRRMALSGNSLNPHPKADLELLTLFSVTGRYV